MKIKDGYAICQCVGEDDAHLFFKCKSVKDVRRRLEFADLESPLHVIENILYKPKSTKYRSLCCCGLSSVRGMRLEKEKEEGQLKVCL